MMYHAEQANDDSARTYALKAILSFLFEDIGYGNKDDMRGNGQDMVVKAGSCWYVSKRGRWEGRLTNRADGG